MNLMRIAKKIVLPGLAVLFGSAAMISGGFAADKIQAVPVVFMDMSEDSANLIRGVPAHQFQKSAAAFFLRKAGTTSSSALLTYGGGVNGVCGETSFVKSLEESDPEEIVGLLNWLLPSGRGSVGKAIVEAIRPLREQRLPRAIVLLTSGGENCGRNICEIANSQQLQSPLVPVHVIGFELGNPAIKEFNCLSSSTAGLFFNVGSSNELEEAVLAIRQRMILPPLASQLWGEEKAVTEDQPNEQDALASLLGASGGFVSSGLPTPSQQTSASDITINELPVAVTEGDLPSAMAARRKQLASVGAIVDLVVNNDIPSQSIDISGAAVEGRSREFVTNEQVLAYADSGTASTQRDELKRALERSQDIDEVMQNRRKKIETVSLVSDVSQNPVAIDEQIENLNSRLLQTDEVISTRRRDPKKSCCNEGEISEIVFNQDAVQQKSEADILALAVQKESDTRIQNTLALHRKVLEKKEIFSGGGNTFSISAVDEQIGTIASGSDTVVETLALDGLITIDEEDLFADPVPAVTIETDPFIEEANINKFITNNLGSDRAVNAVLRRINTNESGDEIFAQHKQKLSTVLEQVGSILPAYDENGATCAGLDEQHRNTAKSKIDSILDQFDRSINSLNEVNGDIDDFLGKRAVVAGSFYNAVVEAFAPMESKYGKLQDGMAETAESELLSEPAWELFAQEVKTISGKTLSKTLGLDVEKRALIGRLAKTTKKLQALNLDIVRLRSSDIAVCIN